MPAQLRHVYYDQYKTPWSCEGMWTHPQHRDYHLNWSGNYVIMQLYGNFKNEIRMVKVEDFDAQYTPAWEPLIVCKFCGFSRMRPCTVRGNCPSLGNVS
jgi:hypothetical protein